jgi:hypothetical protein
MLRATLNEAVPLQVLASDGRTDLYASARLYRADSLLTTVALPHIDGGLYGSTYTPDQEGYLTVVYSIFSDSGMTVPAPYDLEAEIVEVTEDKTDLRRVLGMLHENAVYDQQVYDAGLNLTSGRVRCYRDKLAALNQDPAGLLFTYQLSAAYINGQLSFYRITREQ